MTKFLTFICTIAFSSTMLLAQNNADTIRVNRNELDTLVIIIKEKQSIDHQAKKRQELIEKSQKPAYMVNVGYKVIVQTSNSLGQTSQCGELPHHTDSVSATDSMLAVVQDSKLN